MMLHPWVVAAAAVAVVGVINPETVTIQRGTDARAPEMRPLQLVPTQANTDKVLSVMFNKASYRRGVIEGIILYTLGRLGALINPTVFPDWTFVAVPLLFLALQYFIAPFWATRRIISTKRERLSRRFLLLGPLMAGICFLIGLIIDLAGGLQANSLFEIQRGPALARLFSTGKDALSFSDFALYELRTAIALLALFTLVVICTRLAQGGFLRFTMPAGGNRVTL